MSKRVISKTSKKPKKTASPKRVIDKRNSPTPEKLLADNSSCLSAQDSSCVSVEGRSEATPGGEHKYKVGDKVRIIVDNPCSSILKRGDIVFINNVYDFSVSCFYKNGYWSFMKDQCEPHIDPSEHDLIPTKTDLTVMFICGMLSMASMGLVLWFVMKLLS